MEELAKISVVALTAVILAALLRKSAPEIALVMVLCVGLWVLYIVISGLGAIVALLEELVQLSGLSDALLEPVVKTVVLSILTRLTSELCRSAGEGGIASFVELAGTVFTLIVALPLIRVVMTLMTEILG